MSHGIEVLPHGYRAQREIAIDVFTSSGEIVTHDPLPLEDLYKVNQMVWHLTRVWGISWRNLVIRDGVGIIRTHFAKKFSLDENGNRTQIYRRVLDVIQSTEYFRGRNPSWGDYDPEFFAFGTLGVYDHFNWRGKPIPGIDYSALINLNLESPH